MQKFWSYQTLVAQLHLQYDLSYVIYFVGDVIYIKYDVMGFISKYLHLRRPAIANFADIIKISAIFIKTTFKDRNKVKRIRN